MLPAEVDRRFEGMLLWSGRPSMSVRTSQALNGLADAGMVVAWLAPGPVDQLAAQVGSPAGESGPLLVADSVGGAWIELRHSGGQQSASPPGGGAAGDLRSVGAGLVEVLARKGLSAQVVGSSEQPPRVKVELVSGSAAPLSRTRLKPLLSRHGIPGARGLAELTVDVAHDVGLDDVRVSVSGSVVEITLRDAGDAALEMATELWRQGVDPQALLVILDGLSDLPHRPTPVAVPDIRDATFAVVGDGRATPRSGTLTIPGGKAGLHRILSHQLRLRRQHSLPRAVWQPNWALESLEVDSVPDGARDALFSLADGRIGTGGGPLTGEAEPRRWTVASGIYDGMDAATHLLPGPVTFQLGRNDSAQPLRRVFDLRAGIVHERAGTGAAAVESVRFLALDRTTTALLRVECPGNHRVGPPVRAPGGDQRIEHGRIDGTAWLRVTGTGGCITSAGTQTRVVRGGVDAGPGDRRAVVDRVAAYGTSVDACSDAASVTGEVQKAATIGFDRLLSGHRQAWARRWEHADVVIEGDDGLQRAVRFALFHLMASVADTGEAAVGARGLTGTGYSGHVFWDADAFVLPFLAATHPASARAMLEYRLRRLPPAQDAARAKGRRGARFPWESAGTGDDVTPSSAQDRSGRVVPIRTGQLEEHIVAQIPLAADTYVEWTGDDEFARGPFRRLLVETARYWASRIRVDGEGGAHIYGVIGPDEYHEPVDDNVFTNVLARWNLRRAAELADDGLLGADAVERRNWRDLADAMYDGYDGDTGIYEQFAGFHRLEPLIIAEVAPRRPIAADLLLGAERTHGAQVIKQADVLMLHHLVPDEVVPGSLEPNLRFYERRTAHGSSLSPAIFASLLARARDFESALGALRIAASMDIDNLTGSTSAGLHLATMGGLWQALAFGFAGLRARSGMLHVDPVLPPSWSALELRLSFRGAAVRFRKERAQLSISTDRPISIVVGGMAYTAEPGTSAFRRRGPNWELTP